MLAQDILILDSSYGFLACWANYLFFLRSGIPNSSPFQPQLQQKTRSRKLQNPGRS